MENFKKIVDKFKAKDVSFNFNEIYKQGGKVYKTLHFTGYEVYFSNFDLDSDSNLNVKDCLQFRFIDSVKHVTVVISLKLLDQSYFDTYLLGLVKKSFSNLDKKHSTKQID